MWGISFPSMFFKVTKKRRPGKTKAAFFNSNVINQGLLNRRNDFLRGVFKIVS